MEELRRASHAGLSSITVIQLKKGAQEEDYGSGDESDSEIRVANLGQLEGTCHNAYCLDGGWQIFHSHGQKWVAPIKVLEIKQQFKNFMFFQLLIKNLVEV